MRRAASLYGVLVGVLCLCALARADEDLSVERTRREVDRLLLKGTSVAPATVELRFDTEASSQYELLQASFALDGRPLETSFPLGPLTSQSRILFFGIVEPGPHVFTAELLFRIARAGLFSYVEGYKLKVPGRVTLNAQRGLVLGLRAGVAMHDVSNLSKRLEFVAKSDLKMVTHSEDLATTEPETPADKPGACPKPEAPQVAPESAPAAPKETVVRRRRRKLYDVPDVSARVLKQLVARTVRHQNALAAPPP
jgi:hypothetical protein